MNSSSSRVNTLPQGFEGLHSTSALGRFSAKAASSCARSKS